MYETKTDLSAFNDRQIDAITNENKRLLVLAGAGSGKTKTLLQKLVYLIEEKNVNPSNILAITFTKNAANEMLDRLLVAADETGEFKLKMEDKRVLNKDKYIIRNEFSKKFKWIDGLTIKTFHSLCYFILRNYGANEFDNRFKIVSEEKVSEDDELSKYLAIETTFEVYHKNVIDLCEENQYLLDLKKYILDYIVDKIHIDNKLKKVLPKDGKYYTTLNGEKVRSKSEQYISDWLFRHCIKYEYEPLLNVKDFDFTPDFYIPEADMYLEHISEVSSNSHNKEKQFKLGNLLLVQTFEHMANDTALFNHVLDQIIKERLPDDFQKTRQLVFKEEFNGYHAEVKEFLRHVIRITDLIKVEDVSIEDVKHNSENDQHDRIKTFYKVALPLVSKYKDYCVKKSYLDFNDLITTTKNLFNNHEDILKLFQNKYQYILVDEFQDVNNLQVDLIKKLLTPETQLFCVGDDWQSIYGFRGSNVSYIVDFESHFSNSEVIKLNLNYRSTQHIVGASNEVIKHNKYKVDKEVSASKQSENKIIVFDGNSKDENVEFCIETIRDLISGGIRSDEIMFLYRRTKMFEPYKIRFKMEGIRVLAKTIHGAKGLEAKIVFIIGLTEGSEGFPDIWLEDRIFQVIKKANHELLMEEERRLFYVAITRAKDKLYLITERGHESSFLKEIPSSFTVKTSIPLKSVVEKIPICNNCSSQLEKLHIFCPYCGFKLETV